MGAADGFLHMMITKEDYLSAAQKVAIDNPIKSNAEMV